MCELSRKREDLKNSNNEEKCSEGESSKENFVESYLHVLPFLNSLSHMLITARIMANPKMRSSMGAPATRNPMMDSGL